MFSKRRREHIAGAPPRSLCVGHFGELLEDGDSGRKAVCSIFLFFGGGDVFDFGIRVMLPHKMTKEVFPPFQGFWKSLRRIVLNSLNVW